MRRTVLLIDDEPSLVDVYKMILEEDGYLCHVAADGQAALVLLETISPPDLVLLDCSMPGMSGARFLEALDLRFPRLKEQSRIVGFSLMRQDNPFIRDFVDSLHGFISKPEDFQVFLDSVAEQLSIEMNPKREAVVTSQTTPESLEKVNDEALRLSEERFRLMVEGVNDYAIFMLDKNGIVTTWNEGAKRNKGYTSVEIIGKHFSIFYPEVDLQNGKPEMELRVAGETGRFEDEGWRLRKDGSRFWANVVITAMRDKSGTLIGFSKVTRDLSERKLAEDRLKDSHLELEKRVELRTQELAESNKALEEALSLRDDFLSVASHELKTPVTSLKLQLQMMKRRLGVADESTVEKNLNAVETCARQVDRLNRLIDTLLNVSKIQAGKSELNREEVDLTALCQEIADRFSYDFVQAKTDLEMNLPDSVKLMGDKFKLEQLIVNLLTNAMKYGLGKPVSLSVERKLNQIQIHVQDRGLGIPKEKHQKIFERFERVLSNTKVAGMGLGLFIAREIAIAHGGDIQVQSEVGQGSLFTVELPLDSGAA